MSEAEGEPRYTELARHWPLLAPCIAGIVLSSVSGYSLGVLMPALEQEFGWSRAEISAGPFIIACIALLGGGLGGAVIDRFGPRRVAIAGVLAYCLALANVSTASSELASWWLRWGLLGVAAMFVIPTVWAKAISSTFDRNRGMALAIALCGTGIGAAVVPVLTQYLVANHGWRGAYAGLAGIFAVVVLPPVLLLFRSAADAPSLRAGNAETAAPPLAGLTVREGFASPAFVKLATAVLLFGITSIALTVTAVPILISKGLGPAQAAQTAALIGVGSIIGRLAGGFLLDRVDARLIAAGSVLIPIGFVVLLLAAPGMAWATALGCLLLGLASGTEVDACAYLASKHFGMRSFGTLFGTINGMVFFGAGIAPIIANYAYDLTRSYDAVLTGMIPLCALSAILFLWLGRPRPERQAD